MSVLWHDGGHFPHKLFFEHYKLVGGMLVTIRGALVLQIACFRASHLGGWYQSPWWLALVTLVTGTRHLGDWL